MKNKQLTTWVEGTIFAALAIVLSYIPTKIGVFSISLGMIPVLLYSMRRGPIKGMFCGFLWGILHFLGPNLDILNIWQGLIDYFFAYTFIGLAGAWSSSITRSIRNKRAVSAKVQIASAAILGTIGRYFWHFVSGVIFYGQYAPEGMSAVRYSFIVNGANALATGIVSVLALVLLQTTSEKLFTPKRVSYR